MPEYLFVYGTLRQGSGHAMGEWLAARAHRVGAAGVVGRLYRVSYYPGLAPGEGWVQGDLFSLEADTAQDALEVLDGFEEIHGRPDDEYRRERSAVQLADGRVIEAWVYWYQRDTAGLEYLPGGDWLKP